MMELKHMIMSGTTRKKKREIKLRTEKALKLIKHYTYLGLKLWGAYIHRR